MRVVIRPGGTVSGQARVPGDKSIAHRWLIFAAIGEGESVLRGLPAGEDVRSTARCLHALTGIDPLGEWAEHPAEDAAEDAAGNASGVVDEGQSRTWNKVQPWNYNHEVRVQAEGRGGLRRPAGPLDCGNSGTTMRLLMGLLAGAGSETTLTGDESLRSRPMERVAEPLRLMGARIETVDGHAPVAIAGAALNAIDYESAIASAQVKSAVLIAGLVAEGITRYVEPAATRDHTERLLKALGAPVSFEAAAVTVGPYTPPAFSGTVPGDLSSAVYLLAAAALTDGELTVSGVGLNASRTGFLEVLARMGVPVERVEGGEEMGEPIGDLRVAPGARSGLVATTVPKEEVPLVIDEIPVLAALAAHADGVTRFEGAAELRVKESDRLDGIARGLRALGGGAEVDGDDLVVTGGGVSGGNDAYPADARGDHRLAMAFAVAGLAAKEPATVEGIQWAAVTFPDFEAHLGVLGADLEVF